MPSHVSFGKSNTLDLTFTVSIDHEQIAMLFDVFSDQVRNLASEVLPKSDSASPQVERKIPTPPRREAGVLPEEELLVDVRTVTKLLNLSARTVWSMYNSGQMPAPVRLPGRSVRWRLEEIKAWIDENCPPVEKWRYPK